MSQNHAGPIELTQTIAIMPRLVARQHSKQFDFKGEIRIWFNMRTDLALAIG